MTTKLQRPVEVFPERAVSTAKSTGLDRLSGHRVDGDILSRIRSLLLSRNGHHVPKTPYHSEEDSHHCSEDYVASHTSDRFDSTNGQSVPWLLKHTQTGGLTFSEPSRRRSRSTTLKMDGVRKRSPSSAPDQKRSLRVISSTNDLSASLDDAALREVHLSSCSTPSPQVTNEPFRPFRLVLIEQGGKKKRNQNSRSCNDLALSSQAAGVAKPPKKPDMPCSLRYPLTKLSNDGDYLRRLSKKISNADPAKGGCSLECVGAGEREFQFRELSLPVAIKGTTSTETILNPVAEAMAQPALIVMVANEVSRAFSPTRSEDNEHSENVTSSTADQCDMERPDFIGAVPNILATSSAVFSPVADPYVVQSQDTPVKVASDDSLRSIVITDFSLPGPRAGNTQSEDGTESKQSDAAFTNILDSFQYKPLLALPLRIVESALAVPSDGSNDRLPRAMQPKSSDASLRYKNYLSSLGSVSSKAASIRHALLKASDSDANAVEIPLPIPPVLSHVGAGSSQSPMLNARKPTNFTVTATANEVMTALNTDDSAVTDVVIHLTSLRKAKDLADRIKSRSHMVEGMVDYAPYENDSTIQYSSRGSRHSQSELVAQLDFESMPKSITSLRGILGNLQGAQQPPQDAPPAPVKDSACCSDPLNGTNETTSEGGPRETAPIPGLMEQLPQITPALDLVSAAYREVVPAFKEAVQDAIESAILIAIEEAAMSHGSSRGSSSEVCPELMSDSHKEVAKDMKICSRKASFLNEPPSSIRARSDGHPEFTESTVTDSVPLKCAASSGQPPFISDTKSLAASKDNLKKVSLETSDERRFEAHKKTQKPSGCQIILAKKRSVGHLAIPTRESSKGRALSSKSPTTLDLILKPATRRAQEATLSARPDLLPGFSIRSGKQNQKKEQDRGAQGPGNSNTSRSSIIYETSAGSLGRRSMVDLLRGFVSTNGPYQPRLTALPPRRRRDANSPTTCIRAQVDPAKSVTEICIEAAPHSRSKRSGEAKPGNGSKTVEYGDMVISKPEPQLQHTTSLTQTFTKTINDLEILLNEALLIARQAAHEEGVSCRPALLRRATPGFHGTRHRFVGDIVRRWISDARHRPSRRGENHSNGGSTVLSMHESLGSFSSTDADDSSTDEESKGANPRPIPVSELELTTSTSGGRSTHTSHHSTRWALSERMPILFPSGSIAHPSMQPVRQPLHLQGSACGKPPSMELQSENPKKTRPFLTENAGDDGGISPISPILRSRSTTGCWPKQIASGAVDDLAHRRCHIESPFGPPPMPPVMSNRTSLTRAASKLSDTHMNHGLFRTKVPIEFVPSKQEVHEYIMPHHHLPIPALASSSNLGERVAREQGQPQEVECTESGHSYLWQNTDGRATEARFQEEEIPNLAPTGYLARLLSGPDLPTSISKSFDGSQSDAIHFEAGYGHPLNSGGDKAHKSGSSAALGLRDMPNFGLSQITQRGVKKSHFYNLRGRNHISLRGKHHKGFSFARTHKKPKIARDWAPARKRFVGTVACTSTALVGLLLGIYGAEVPAVQYWIVDFHHYTILGNVFFLIGLSIPTFFFWPLPLLHGRKPYILVAMSLAMPLLFPQALAVGQFRSPFIDYWRIGLIMPRGLMGFILGFANMNFKATLLDLFGASLQSENPHQEFVDENDVRRHGGGLGVWLGIWTWCTMGSTGLGFLIGAILINHANPAWGFYISIAIIAFVLLLNIICPEVRRSAFRRSVAELKLDERISRRLGRGEVKMHMVQTGPKWWGEEFHYGVKMNVKMLRQPGFMILAIYVSWIYGQVVLLVVVSASTEVLSTWQC